MERQTHRYAVLPRIIDHGLASLSLAAPVALPLSTKLSRSNLFIGKLP